MRESIASSFDLRRSNIRSSSGLELKSVNSTRATLQEVGFFLLWFFSTLRAIWPCSFCPKGLFG